MTNLISILKSGIRHAECGYFSGNSIRCAEFLKKVELELKNEAMEPKQWTKSIPEMHSGNMSNLKQILKGNGYSISGWARANGYNRISVSLALSGRMNGRLGKEIRKRVEVLKG